MGLVSVYACRYVLFGRGEPVRIVRILLCIIDAFEYR